MKDDLIQSLTTSFEGHAQQTESGVEYWLARDLQHLLGYGKWDNFLGVVSKAKTACEVSGHAIADHFADVGKMVELGSGSQREIDDILLTRYPPRKPAACGGCEKGRTTPDLGRKEGSEETGYAGGGMMRYPTPSTPLDDLTPLLHKLAQGREISGLSAYER